MVRNYKRTTKKCSYSNESLQMALDSIRKGEMSRKKASNSYGIPRSTLIKQLKLRPTDHHQPRLGRYRPVFSDSLENELVMHVVDMQNRFYGLSLMELRKIAYELASRNGINHPFSKESKMAGIEWARGFMRRFPELSLRTPEPTSMARIAGFNRVQVQRFYSLLKTELDSKKFTPDQLFNIDETGITVVQKPGRILAAKGCKQVGRAVSGEKGTTTTVVCAMNAVGTYIPPMFLFKRKRWNSLLTQHAPVGSVGFPSDNGWMNADLFVEYLKHFIKFARPTASRPLLVVFDGHASHKSLQAVELARDNFITFITIPPHTSHRLQPLDLTFFGALKKAFFREMDNWMTRNPGKRVCDYDICNIFTPAFVRTANIEKAVNGFKASGICPYNDSIFTDVEFAPSMVTERNLPVDQPETVETQTASSSTQHQTNGTELPALNCPSPADKQQVGVTDISPLPQVSYSGTRKRRAETSEVLTGTPYKNRLLDSVTRKNVGCRRMLHADKNSTASERTDSQSKCRKEQNKQTPSARVGSKSKPSCAQKARTSRRPKSRQESRTPSHKALYGKTVSDSGFLKKGSRLTTVRKPTWLSEKNGRGRLAVFPVFVWSFSEMSKFSV